jgi:quinol monooxygenase YgiN
MAQVSVLARVTAREGKDDELVAAFEPLIDQVRNEPGTLLYVMNRAKNDPNVFWFSELYADEDAFASHGASDAMANAMPVLGPLIAESELIVGEPVLAKDLPGLAL